MSRERGSRKAPAWLTPWYTLLPVEGSSCAGRESNSSARLHGDDNGRKERHTPDPCRTEHADNGSKADACLLEQYVLFLTSG